VKELIFIFDKDMTESQSPKVGLQRIPVIAAKNFATFFQTMSQLQCKVID
jgi:hypothetical protein